MPKPKLSTDQRRALELLASHGNGCSEATMVAHGFSRALIAEIVLAGYAGATIDRAIVGGQVVEARHIKITGPGWWRY
jgi:hypothetical protein